MSNRTVAITVACTRAHGSADLQHPKCQIWSQCLNVECPMQHDILLVHTNGHNYFMIARRAIMIEGLSFVAIELSEIEKYMVIAFPFPLFSNFLLVVVVYM